jgi:hypothetical protein
MFRRLASASIIRDNNLNYIRSHGVAGTTLNSGVHEFGNRLYLCWVFFLVFLRRTRKVSRQNLNAGHDNFLLHFSGFEFIILSNWLTNATQFSWGAGRSSARQVIPFPLIKDGEFIDCTSNYQFIKNCSVSYSHILVLKAIKLGLNWYFCVCSVCSVLYWINKEIIKQLLLSEIVPSRSDHGHV